MVCHGVLCKCHVTVYWFMLQAPAASLLKLVWRVPCWGNCIDRTANTNLWAALQEPLPSFSYSWCDSSADHLGFQLATQDAQVAEALQLGSAPDAPKHTIPKTICSSEMRNVRVCAPKFELMCYTMGQNTNWLLHYFSFLVNGEHLHWNKLWPVTARLLTIYRKRRGSTYTKPLPCMKLGSTAQWVSWNAVLSRFLIKWGKL